MSAKNSINNWFHTNKAVIFHVVVWMILSALGGLATALVPVIPPTNKLVDLILAATVVLNVLVVYIAFNGSARSVFKPTGFLDSVKFMLRKDMLTSLAGVLLFGIALISIPPLATGGTWHIPTGYVSVIAFICSWLAISYSMKMMYSIQFFEEVLTPTETVEYRAEMTAKPTPVKRTGMFLVDINSRFRSGLNRLTRSDKKRTHKLIFPFLQALFVLLAPAILLFWSLYVFDIAAYTVFSAISAPVVMSLAASLWAAWHVKGGFSRVVTKRVGRVMATSR